MKVLLVVLMVLNGMLTGASGQPNATLTSPSNMTDSSEWEDNELFEFIPAKRPSLQEGTCCSTLPYNVTNRHLRILTHLEPYIAVHTYLYEDRCVVYPYIDWPWCKVYKQETYINYRLVTKEGYKTVVREIFCRDGDEICCTNYTKYHGQCIKDEELEKVKVNRTGMDLLSRFVNGAN